MLSKRQKFVKRITLPLALVVFVGLFVTDIFFVPPAASDTLVVSNGRVDSSGIQIEAVVLPAPVSDEFENIKISNDFSPRIDSEAAMVVKEGNQIKPVCFTPLGVQKTLTGRALPGELWIFLLAAYLFLLFFNLFYDFERATKIRPIRSPFYSGQDSKRPEMISSSGVNWFWEGLYTILALWGWYVWDTCHQNLWFPLYVLKLGTIVYLTYLYLYYKKKEKETGSPS